MPFNRACRWGIFVCITPELSRAAKRARLERIVRQSSDCFRRRLLGLDRGQGQVVDTLHTLDMAQALNKAGR